MASSPAISFRLAQEVQDELKRQAENIGLNVTEYLRMLIKLDLSTNIIKQLEQKEYTDEEALNNAFEKP